MATAEPARAHFSTAEITVAIRALGSPERARLRLIARSLARLSPVEADDLSQEALERAMEGKRLCPRDLPLIPFLAGVMRSIASDAAKARKRHPERSLALMAEAGQDWPAESLTAEQALVASQDERELEERANTTRRKVLELFDDDLVAQIVAEGIMDDLEGEELRALTELHPTAFASKRKLIRRRIAKAFPESLKQ